MRRYRINLIFGLVVLWFAATADASAPTSPFDSFGDIKCEDEQARLDNFAVALQNYPEAKGHIVVHGGRTFRGRLPRRGEAQARAARMKPYLVNYRGLPAGQIVVVDGGYGEDWGVVLWIVPPGAAPPEPRSSIPIEEIKFRRGRVSPREYRCPFPRR